MFSQSCRFSKSGTAGLVVLMITGCELYVADADRDVYRLTQRAQLEALGASSDVYLGEETGMDRTSWDAYDFAPSPITSDVPEEFLVSQDAPIEPLYDDEPLDELEELLEGGERVDELESEGATPDTAVEPPEGQQVPDATPDDTTPMPDQEGEDDAAGAAVVDDDVDEAAAEDQASIEDLMGESCDLVIEDLELGDPISLEDVIKYSNRNSRDLQDAKEDLYLQALALTLERHLWTPRFMSQLSATYTDARLRDDDNTGTGSEINQTFDFVGDLSLEQRLPYGGQIVATYMTSMVRDLEAHITNVESGSVIIEADIPLLRGAGPAAYESRYSAERNLIYEARRYERFRRSYVVDVASDYFRLQSLRISLRNAIVSREGFRETLERSLAFQEANKVDRSQTDRARTDFLRSCTTVIDRMQALESGLDNFKILIGMPTTAPLDVFDQEEVDLTEPGVGEDQAIETALGYRLDLLTIRDQIEDAQRGLSIARNNMLPDLDLRASLGYSSNPDHRSVWDLREDTRRWSVGMDLDVPIDRKAERNQLRAAVIGLRRAEREADLAEDRVRRDVRLALRRIRQARLNLVISDQNVSTTEVRLDAARTNFFLGLKTNQDVVDAENGLRDARDEFAAADAALREAILRLRLETGILRVAEDGYWLN